MALGIGANTAIFSVVYSVLLADLPYAEGDRLVVLRQQRPLAGIQAQNFSVKEIQDFREQSRALEQIVEYHSMWFVLLGRGEPERVQTAVVSHNFFDVLGVKPVFGRTFRAEDDRPGADATLVLSYGYWQSRFGGDPSVVGQVFEMNDRPHTVIGVLPPVPQYPQENDVYMSVSACPFRSAQPTIDNRNARLLQAFGRTRAGVSQDQLRSDLSGVAGSLQEAYPESYPTSAGYDAVATRLRDELTTAFRPVLLVLLGAAAFVLLIVCASVANLILARLVRREREMAVRAALGAGRWRLFRQLLVESSLLALIGATLGLLLAGASLDLLVAYAARFTTRAQEISLSLPVLLFTLGVAGATGILVGLLPALPSRVRLASAMQDGGRTVSAGRMRFRAALIVAQVAASFALLIAAGLMLRSLSKLQAVDVGVRSDRVLTMRVALNFTKYNSQPLVRDFQTQLLDRLRGVPGVRSVGAAATFPLNDGGNFSAGVLVQGQPEVDPARLPRADINSASPGYFQTVGIPLVRGRFFTERDRDTGPPVALISQSMARHLFGDADPVGARLSLNQGQTWVTVVGVVGDVRRQVDAAPADALYLPLAQGAPLTTMFLVRADEDPSLLVRQMREAVYSLDPQQPVDRFRTYDEVRAGAVANQRLTTSLIGGFAGLALVITALGLAGVIAFSVNQRTQEFGVRMALGASRVSLVRMVLAQGMRLVAIGLVIGVGGALALGRLLRALLYDVETTDALTFAGVALVLAAVAIAACLVPARRASSVDPMAALRSS
jgi:putative ABC transport system permease protein